MKIQTESLTIDTSGTLLMEDDSTLLIPKFAAADIPAAAAGNKGMLVYDEDNDVLKLSTGSAWLTVATV